MEIRWVDVIEGEVNNYMYGFVYASGAHFTALKYNNNFLSTKEQVQEYIFTTQSCPSKSFPNTIFRNRQFNKFVYKDTEYTFESAKDWSNNDSTISICALIVGKDDNGTIINIPLFELDLYKTGNGHIMFDSVNYYKINDTKYKQQDQLPKQTKQILPIDARSDTFKIEDIDIVRRRGGKSTKKRKTLRKTNNKKRKTKGKSKTEKRRLSKRKKNKYKNKISNKI